MKHPILRNSSFRNLYIALWVMIFVIHTAIFAQFSSFGWVIMATDALVSNFIFSLFGIGLWYVILYYTPKIQNVFNVVFNHFSVFVVWVLIWIFLSYEILTLSFADNAGYLIFFQQSIPVRVAAAFFIYITTGSLYYLIMYYGNLQTKMSEEANMRAAIREAELNMLKSQINPHFLFNSLNSVSSLTVSNPQKAQNMIVKLSDYMRYMVSVKADQLTSFRAEFQNIERYLAIEHIRFGNRLIYEPVVQDLCLDFPIPSLILQPLFENAIKHGVHESTEPITISLRCTLVNGMLEVLIRNNFDPEGQIRKGTGIGLKNIADRLRLHYNSDNLLKIVKTETHFEVRLYFPSVIEKTEML